MRSRPLANLQGRRVVAALGAVAWLLLFVCAAFRHAAFQSTAFDLAIFDQALWQLSRGEGARVSLLGMNIFSDHGAFILYPLSLLYWVVASPYALFALQALSLALGAWPLLLLAEKRGLGKGEAVAAVAIYLCNPVVFSANLFDFHPETLGAPLIPLLFLFAEERKLLRLLLVAAAIMSCKEVLSLTVAAVGVVMALRRRWAPGASLALGGLAWFVLVTQVVMPGIPQGAAPNAFARYGYLGETLSDKLIAIGFKPLEVAAQVPIRSTALYIVSLVIPCFWIFRRQTAVFLLACAPTILLNSLSTLDFQRSLRFQYSLPLIPVFGVMAVELLAKRELLPRWWSSGRAVLFSFAALVVPLVSRNIAAFGLYPVAWAPIGSVEALSRAVALIPPEASVLASSRLLPHLAHRVNLGLIDGEPEALGFGRYVYVVVDKRHSRDAGDLALSRSMESALRSGGSHEVLLDLPDVALFRRVGPQP